MLLCKVKMGIPFTSHKIFIRSAFSCKINLLFFSCLKDMTLKCNEEGRSLSSEAFTKISISNLRRPAVPDLSTDMSLSIFKKVYFFDFYRTAILTHFVPQASYDFVFSLRTVKRTGRGKVQFPSTTQERRGRDAWVCHLSCMRITWMCLPHAAPSHSEAFLD